MTCQFDPSCSDCSYNGLDFAFLSTLSLVMWSLYEILIIFCKHHWWKHSIFCTLSQCFSSLTSTQDRLAVLLRCTGGSLSECFSMLMFRCCPFIWSLQLLCQLSFSRLFWHCHSWLSCFPSMWTVSFLQLIQPKLCWCEVSCTHVHYFGLLATDSLSEFLSCSFKIRCLLLQAVLFLCQQGNIVCKVYIIELTAI